MQPTFSSSRILLPVHPWFIFFSLCNQLNDVLDNHVNFE